MIFRPACRGRPTQECRKRGEDAALFLYQALWDLVSGAGIEPATR